jgi:hypothetical protein
VQYSFLRPITVTRKDQTSIDTYTGGVPKEATIIREDLLTVEDCSALAAAQLALYSTPFVKIDTVRVFNESDIKVGQQYQFNDFLQGYTYLLVARTLTQSYPYRYDIISLGDAEYRTYNWDVDRVQRLRRIEEQQISATDLVTEITDLSTDSFVGPRHIYRLNRDTSSDTIWGRFNWGSANWDGTYSASPVEDYRFPGDNYFEELLYDSEYYDSGASTNVTWDTSAKEITIANGVLVTKPLTRGVVISSVNVQFGNSSGSAYTTEVSCDGGSTWQTITSFGIRVPITTTSDGTTTLLRVSTSGTSYFENTYKNDGTVNAASMAVYFETA